LSYFTNTLCWRCTTIPITIGHHDGIGPLTLGIITTVAGNVPLEHTTANACRLRSLLGLDVEVHAGADGPLVGEQEFARHVHGETGLGDVVLPEPDRGPDSDDAVGYLVETTRSEEGLHLVPIGPLTNVALALRADPGLAHRVAIIDRGKLLCLDTPESLKKTVGEGDTLEIVLAGAAPPAVQRLQAELAAQFHRVSVHETTILINDKSLIESVAAITNRVNRAGVAIQSITLRENTLEDVFIALTGRRLRTG